MSWYRLAVMVLTLASPLALAQEVITIPEGQFKHPVLLDREVQTETVPAFAIDRHPVSRQAYANFVQNHPSWRRSGIPGLFHDGGYLRDWSSDLEPGEDLASPVTRISWYSARAYCHSQGGQLPSLVQWEHLVSLIREHNAISDADYARAIFAWYGEQRQAQLNDAHFGTTGFIGLVNEWVEDYQLLLSNGEKVDFGGGSCGDTARLMVKYDQAHYATFFRYQSRSNYTPKTTTSNLGFRCAYDLE